MTRKDFKYTLEFCNRYAKQVVKAIKDRAAIDTGSMKADVNYRITFYAQAFNIVFYIDDHIVPVSSNLLPSEYGDILDRNDFLDHTHGSRSTQHWFSAPIPGLGANYFLSNVERTMKQDVEAFIEKQVKDLNVQLKKKR